MVDGILKEERKGKTEYYYDRNDRLVCRKNHMNQGNGRKYSIKETWFYYDGCGDLIHKCSKYYFIKTDKIKYCLYDGDFEEIAGFTCDDDMIYHDILRDSLISLLESLNPKERDVLTLYYGLNGDQYNFTQIAEMYDLSPARIAQIHKCALRKLRKPKCARKLKDFLY